MSLADLFTAPVPIQPEHVRRIERLTVKTPDTRWRRRAEKRKALVKHLLERI